MPLLETLSHIADASRHGKIGITAIGRLWNVYVKFATSDLFTAPIAPPALINFIIFISQL